MSPRPAALRSWGPRQRSSLGAGQPCAPASACCCSAVLCSGWMHGPSSMLLCACPANGISAIALFSQLAQNTQNMQPPTLTVLLFDWAATPAVQPAGPVRPEQAGAGFPRRAQPAGRRGAPQPQAGGLLLLPSCRWRTVRCCRPGSAAARRFRGREAWLQCSGSARPCFALTPQVPSPSQLDKVMACVEDIDRGEPAGFRQRCDQDLLLTVGMGLPWCWRCTA